MVVDKRTILNENRERIHVRWTAKRGNEIDLIGKLNVACLLGHSRGLASICASFYSYFLIPPVRKEEGIGMIPQRFSSFTLLRISQS